MNKREGYGTWGDVEAGELYPMMLESPELRWAFIRKVYSILSVQLALTIIVGGVVVSVPEIPLFFASSGQGFALYIFILILPLLGMNLFPLSF